MLLNLNVNFLKIAIVFAPGVVIMKIVVEVSCIVVHKELSGTCRVKRQLEYKYLVNGNLLNRNQCGFTERIFASLNCKDKSVGLFIDFKKILI